MLPEPIIVTPDVSGEAGASRIDDCTARPLSDVLHVEALAPAAPTRRNEVFDDVADCAPCDGVADRRAALGRLLALVQRGRARTRRQTGGDAPPCAAGHRHRSGDRGENPRPAALRRARPVVGIQVRSRVRRRRQGPGGIRVPRRRPGERAAGHRRPSEEGPATRRHQGAERRRRHHLREPHRSTLSKVSEQDALSRRAGVL